MPSGNAFGPKAIKIEIPRAVHVQTFGHKGFDDSVRFAKVNIVGENRAASAASVDLARIRRKLR